MKTLEVVQLEKFCFNSYNTVHMKLYFARKKKEPMVLVFEVSSTERDYSSTFYYLTDEVKHVKELFERARHIKTVSGMRRYLKMHSSIHRGTQFSTYELATKVSNFRAIGSIQDINETPKNN